MLLSVDCFFPLRSFSMADCPRAQSGHGPDPAVGCAQSRGPEEMAPQFTTHPTGIRGYCDKGHKTCGFPMNKHPTFVPPVPLHGCWAGLTGQGSILKERLQYVFSEEGCYLEPVRSMHRAGPWMVLDIKGLNLSF